MQACKISFAGIFVKSFEGAHKRVIPLLFFESIFLSFSKIVIVMPCFLSHGTWDILYILLSSIYISSVDASPPCFSTSLWKLINPGAFRFSAWSLLFKFHPFLLSSYFICVFNVILFLMLPVLTSRLCCVIIEGFKYLSTFLLLLFWFV